MKGIVLSVILLLGIEIFAQPVVVDSDTTNLFAVGIAATNYTWSLDGVAVGGNSNSYAYTPQVFDVGTHYLLVNQTLPGAVNSNAYWGVRVRIPLPVSGANYYVATNGSTNNPGTIGAPFLTLEQARNAIRSNGVPAGGVTVWLRGGTHYRTNTLMLTNANDSGRAGAPVVWRSYSNEVAVISGGKAIPAASWVPLNSSQTNRVYPGLNPTNIWEMDLTATGLTHTNPFPALFGSWTIFNIYGQGADGGLCELFYNGQRQYLSRWPHHSLVNDDLLTTNTAMDGVAKGLVTVTNSATLSFTNYLNSPGYYTNSAGQAIAVGGAFYCKTNDVARFTRWQSAITNGGLWLQGYWRVSWQVDTIKIAGFDATNRAVLLDTNAQPALGIGNKYARPTGSSNEMFFAVNLLEEMNQPGEWCVDFNRNKIYFYAPGLLANGSVVISDFGAPLVQVSGTGSVTVSNVVFQGLNFEAGLAQGILITNGIRNLVLGCSFRNMGNYPVEICGGGTNGVVSCDMTNLAAGGVLLRGGTESTNAALRVPAQDFVVNNLITNYSRVARVYAAAVDAGFFGVVNGGGGGHYACVGNRVAHNFISTSPHSAVLHASFDNVFEYNEISHFQQVSDDLGAFYSYDYTYNASYSPPRMHGNQTFRYNFIHDSPYGNGIDFDQDSPNMHIYGNVMNLNTYVPESQGYGVVYHDYNRHTIGNEQPVDNYNNLYVNTHVGAKFVSSVPPIKLEANAAIICTSNNYTWELVTNYSGEPTNRFVTSSQAVMQSGANTNYSTDPGFLSLTNNDLRLNPASRVYTDLPNFQQIPVELIGLYNDEFRANAGGYGPFITTSNATAVTGTNVTVNGRLFFPQFESNTVVTVYYGPTDGGSDAPGWAGSANLGTFAAGAVSGSLGWLPGGTNYFRLFAANPFGSAWSPTSFTVVTTNAVFTNLVSGLTALSNGVVAFSGQVTAKGPQYPASNEVVTIIVNGITNLATITNATGNFALSLNLANLFGYGVYPVTYVYAGNTNLASATNGATTLTVGAPTVVWSGTAGTNFETGGVGGNWNNWPAPLNDIVSSTAIFGATPTANQPSLTASRSVAGLSLGATNGGWTLGSGSRIYVLSLGAGGLSSGVQTNGTNVIGAGLNVAANQTWEVGAGGTLLFTGSITNFAAPTTNYSLSLNRAGTNGTVILSPGAGNFIKLTGTNGAAMLQLANGGLLQLGGDGVTGPVTTSTNYVVNGGSGAGSLMVVGGTSRVQVNSGTWNFGDFSRNAATDALSGQLDVNAGGTLVFAGARYVGGGTINVNGGTLRFANTNSLISNGAMFQLGYGGTGTATLNLSNGLVDVAVSAIVGSVSSGIGAGQSALLNQSGGILRNAITPGSGVNTSFSIGGLPYAGGLTNNRTAFTLAGGTLLSAGTVMGGTNAGPGSMNNFNFMGGVLAVQSFNATNLGSSPTATVTANQTNVSLALGTLANYGGVLAPGNLGVPGKTIILGNYAISNQASVLAIDIGGTNQANAFQNGATNFDFVAITGSAALGGGLNINLINGFVPAATNSFIILTNGGSLSGNFTNLVGGRVAVTNISGGSFDVVTNRTKVVLTNFVLLQANFSASATNGATPLSVTFTDNSTGIITNRFWSFGDGATTNTTATNLAHTFAGAGTNQVTLIVSDGLWNSTNSLAVVVVGALVPPVIGGISLSGSQLVIAGTNGTAGENYYVLATTNLFLPMTNWDIISTNQFGAGGSINFTSPLNPSLPQIYYRLRRP